MKKRPSKLMIGWRETVSLPDLGLDAFPAKIDTGARTTAIHASDIKLYKIDGQTWVEFTPNHAGLTNVDQCRLPVHHKRKITNTSGVPEERVVAITELQIGERAERIEVSLSDRTDMRFPMIVGRTALRQLRLTVDPSRSWLQSTKPQTKKDMT